MSPSSPIRRPRLRLEGKPFAGVELRRDANGVAEILAADDTSLARGLGFCHAHDRQVQMMTLRIIGEGRLSECLATTEETLWLDTFCRDLAFARIAAADAPRCSPEVHALATAYAEGVNEYLSRHLPAGELLALGYRPEPWTVRDVLLTILVMTYFGLAQTQQDLEKFLIQAIAGGTDVARLRSLFRPHLDGLDDDIVALIRKVRIERGLIPAHARFLSAVPKFVASNNWAVAGARSSSGGALLSCDPHLEVNRLPAIWYEVIGRVPGDYRIGITVPGAPAIVMGRTRSVSFGFTYGYMDMIDYFVEEVRGGRVRREHGDEPIVERVERISRKKGPPLEVVVRETSHGVLETDGRSDLPDGLYLARAWSGHGGGMAQSLDGFLRLLASRDVVEAQAAVRDVMVSGNWLLADRGGRIAYQQSGRLPDRRHSGLYPLPGWDRELAWRGIVASDRLAAVVDPADGVLATANDPIDLPGFPKAINGAMGSYRADRIRQVLAQKERHDLGDMKRLQRDLYSLQARRFLAFLRPFLPDTEAGRTLRDWDLCYDRGSKGAALFERVYAALLRAVFGEGLFGLDVWDVLVHETSLMAIHYQVFDDALLGDDPSWFGGEGRDALVRRVVAAALRDAPPRTWGEERRATMQNILFGGRLPRWTGFDRGPFEFEGSRATVVQSIAVTAHGRKATLWPSWRFVTDMSRDEADTVLAGGPSGRRTSRLYASDVERWLRYEYKTLA